jgi:xanthine/uracil/vitamin C permease (AzgA family)
MRVAAFFRALVRRDVFLLAFLGLALADLVPVAVVWYALIAAGHLVMSLLHLANGGMPRR